MTSAALGRRAPIAYRLVHDVRAVGAGHGEWAVAFAEAEPTPNPGVRPHVDGLLVRSDEWDALAHAHPVLGARRFGHE
jgi:hypothetical protein